MTVRVPAADPADIEDASGRPSRTLAWFHCFSGIAGDMALGSLVDAGADPDEVRALLRRLPVGGWEVTFEPVLRCGIAATKARVHAPDTAVVRTAAHITGLVEEARLPPRVTQRALATFRALADVEGRLHRRPPEQVHFHEVGGLDAIVDVVGTAAALEVLGVDDVRSSSVANGTGMVRAAHGMLPNPAPAVVGLLQGAPTHGVDIPVELTTPTGAALLAATVTGWGPLPAMRIEASGFGAGDREIDGRPNAVQVVVGEAATTGAGDGAQVGLAPGQPVLLLEANVDDATGEVLAHAVAALLDAGAHDAWVTPVVMKKGRPAHVVSALADPAVAAQVAQVLTAETGSLGVRGSTLERWPRSRSTATVEVAGMPVRVKLSPGRVKVEHDDAARVAELGRLPLREVMSLAEAEARRADEPHGTPGDSGDDLEPA
ncbi:MAG TPA: nickel pincer cofactor biosynthesis protein LarC [Acidimicrobiales bacterium]|nr:nickel pincer cofactor biosynthesis protein LarC [Acidimicrobiales bacterium]